MVTEDDKGKKQIRFIIVPDFIIDDLNIPDGEKLLFGEIASNSLEKGFCWFSNKHLMERFHIGERTASRWVNDLRKKGYITIKIVKRKGSEEVDERQISVDTTKPVLAEYMNWYRQKRHQGIANNGKSPPVKNGAVNNKELNNKDVIDLKDITNVYLSQGEYQSLINEFGKQKLESGIIAYSNWKQKVNAHPKSDLDSLRKWLSKAQNKYKAKLSSVKETGVDEVKDEELDNLPF
ncbi:MAG: helix-turn-helix domain-containing protein [Treponema sp.]|nr:helix-turn-helix domain-containing protein [Treponema sp.]MCI6592726.1 helix-turn-helix domain-containing protein [Spirochaetia bacterium]MDD7533230.1 helix-turn-helix domain-containing protein [Treponema sp.]MDY5758289.1 helix-turn-helix domain-containing protein [Treponema sp.]MDY5818110.1 helix-turn-helix domain-containing protein [Treponema sp.]